MADVMNYGRLNGLRVFMAQPHLFRWVHRRAPSKVAGRRGTRRAWKRKYGSVLHFAPGLKPSVALTGNGCVWLRPDDYQRIKTSQSFKDITQCLV